MQCYSILNSNNLLNNKLLIINTIIVPSKCSLGQATWAQSPEPHVEYYLCEPEQVISSLWACSPVPWESCRVLWGRTCVKHWAGQWTYSLMSVNVIIPEPHRSICIFDSFYNRNIGWEWWFWHMDDIRGKKWHRIVKMWNASHLSFLLK